MVSDWFPFHGVRGFAGGFSLVITDSGGNFFMSYFSLDNGWIFLVEFELSGMFGSFYEILFEDLYATAFFVFRFRILLC